mmetsp:Transcript_7658/g.14110  ORF Transcript_7658/g.14110 Transcript_7658/m.14110 type:complete len:89 (+) Transcript_7658:371-637(+)
MDSRSLIDVFPPLIQVLACYHIPWFTFDVVLFTTEKILSLFTFRRHLGVGFFLVGFLLVLDEIATNTIVVHTKQDKVYFWAENHKLTG